MAEIPQLNWRSRILLPVRGFFLRRRVRQIAKWLRINRGASVLDLGGGSGGLALHCNIVALHEGLFPATQSEIELNRPPSEVASRTFKLRRAFINYIHLAAFRTRLLNRLFYNSIFADALHEVLWFLRRQSLIHKFLYGRFGSGEARRGAAGAPTKEIEF